MGVWEEQARFLVAKYGTAAGPTGLAPKAAPTFDLAVVMVALGLVLFAVILAVLLRDYRQERRVRAIDRVI